MTDPIECASCIAGPTLVSLDSLISLGKTLKLLSGAFGPDAADKLRGQEVRDAPKAPASTKNVGPTAKQSTQSDKRRAERVNSSASSTTVSSRQRRKHSVRQVDAKGRAK